MAKFTQTTMPTFWQPENGTPVFGEEWSQLENAIYYLAGYSQPSLPTTLCKELFEGSEKSLKFEIHKPPCGYKMIFWVSTLQEGGSGDIQELEVTVECGSSSIMRTIYQAENAQITQFYPIEIGSETALNAPTDYATIEITIKNNTEGTCYLTAFGGAFLPRLAPWSTNALP